MKKKKKGEMGQKGRKNEDADEITSWRIIFE